MKNLKKLIAIAVASSMVMSTTVLAKTTTANRTANYQKADTTYGQNFDSAIAATGLPTSVTSIITTLYGSYGMNKTQEDSIITVVNNLQNKVNQIKATATANGTTTPTTKEIALNDTTFRNYAIGQVQLITMAYGLIATPNATMTGGTITDPKTGTDILTIDKSQFDPNDFNNVSRNQATLLAQLTTALDAAVAATSNGANTEMPVATPTTTATSTATTGAATGTETAATGTAATGTAATGTTTGGTTTPGAGAGTGGDVATGITYGQALDNAIAATKLPTSVTSIISTLYGKYGMTQTQEGTILSVVDNLIAKAYQIKATAVANGTTTPSALDIALNDTTFRNYAIGQAQIITMSYGLIATPNATMTGGTISDPKTGTDILTVDKSQFNKDDFNNISHDKATLLAQLKTALDAAVSATTYGSTTVIPTTTGTATTGTATTGTATTGTATTGTATTGTTTTGTTTAPTTSVQDLANTLTNYGVPADFVTTITNVLNALPTSVQNTVANIVNTFLKSARSAADLAAAKAAIDADTTLTTAQKDAAKAALDQAAALLPATITATGTATGTTTGTTTGTATVAGGSSNGTTPSVLPKTATEAANMAVAGLAMITVAGTIFFISKKRMA